MTDTRKAQLEIGVNAGPAEDGFKRVENAAKGMGQEVSKEADKTAKALKGMGEAAKHQGDETQKGSERAKKGLKEQGEQSQQTSKRVEADTRNMIASVQRATAAYEAGEKGTAKYYETLAKQRGLNLSEIKPHLDAMRAMEAAQDKFGMSARATSAAMRNVPAQFTDIVTSLQGGQAPLTVFLQQGGQLKDMFGGAGNAARALGGYVAGLINPFTAAAAGVGVLGLAYYQGSKEADAFRLAIVNSGNAAGASVAQLAGMAETIGSSYGKTTGAAAAALAQLSATGEVGRANLLGFATTALEAERTLGIAVKDIAKNFADLAKDPAAASLKLNESMRYLTASTYEQIRAAQDLGQSTKAAQIAQDAYNNALKSRAAEVAANAGTIEKAWSGIKNAATGAWDAMLGVGRPVTVGAQLGVAQKNLEAALEKRKGVSDSSAFAPALDKEIAKLREQVGYISEIERIQKRAGDSAAERVAKEEAGIKAQQDALKYLTDEQKMRNDIAQQTATMIKAGKTQAEIEERIAQIRASYAKKGASGAGAGESEAATLRAQVTEAQRYLDALQQTGTELDKLTTGEKAVLKIREELKGNLTAQVRAQKEKALSEAESLAAIQKATEAERDNQDIIKKSAEANAKAFETAAKRTETLAQEVARQREQNAAIGLTKEATADLTAARLEDAAATAEQNAQTQDLINPAIAAELRAQAEQYREMARLKREGANKEAASEAAKQAEAALKKTEETTRRAAERMEDYLTNAILRGFENGKSFAENFRDTLKNMFNTMVLRPIIQAVVGGVTGLGAAGASANGGGNALDTFSNLHSLYSAGSAAASVGGQWLAGTMSSANAAGTIGANAAGAGLDGLLASNGAFGTAGSSATAIGSAATMMGGALVGFMAGKMISGGYSAVGKSGNTAVAAGTAIGAIMGGPIGAMIGGAIGGTVNRAFGRKAAQVTGEGIKGTFSGSGADVQSYQELFSKGGWFRSDKRETRTSAVSSEFDQMLDQSLASIGLATRTYAKAIGLSAESVAGYSQSIDISLKGLDAAGQEKAIAEALAKFGNGMAEQLLGSFETVVTKTGSFFKKRTTETSTWIAGPFVRAGETAGQALERLGTSLIAVNGVLGTLNQSLLATSLAGADAASQLIEVFGGVQALAQGTAAYYQAFYSEAERGAKTTEQVTAAMKAMGLAMPSSTAGFRALVEAQDLTTDAGRRTYAQLIQLAPAFQQAASAMDQLIGSIGAIRNEAVKLVDSQIETSRSAAEAARNAAEAFGLAGQSLREAASSILMRLGDVARNTRSAYTQTLASAQTGNIDALRALPDLAQTMIAEQRSRATTGVEASIFAARTAAELTNAAKVAGTAGAAKNYEAALYEVNTAVLEVMRADLEANKATSDSLRQQLTALKSIENMLSVTSDAQQIAIQTVAGAVVSTGQQQIAAQINTSNGVAGAVTNTSKAQELALGLINKTTTAGVDLQDQSLGVVEVATKANIGSKELLSSVLAQLKTPDTSLEVLNGNVVVGNQLVSSKIELLISAVNQQTAAQQAEVRRVQDLAKTQKALESASSLAKSLQTAAREAEAAFAATSETVAVYLGRGGKWGTGSARYRYDPNPAYAEAQRTALAAQAAVQAQLDQLDSLRKTIVNLGGVPAFATGAAFTNSVVSRPTAFNIGVMGEKTPEAIMPLANVGGSLGVRARMPGAEQMTAELRKLLAEIKGLRDEAQSTAISSERSARILDRVTRGTDSLIVTTE